MRNFLKTFFLSWLIQIAIHSFSFAEIGFQSAGMELFNPKNPFKKSFTPLKDKVLIYTYLDHDHQGVSNWVDQNINAGIKPKQRVAFVNDYVVFLNDHNKDIVKDLDQNLKFEGSKVDILILHPDRYTPGTSYGPWRTFKYDPLYQSGDPKDFVELIRAPGKKPVKEEMKVLVEEKIHQLTKNDNFKKFFNNKPMSIKALNETIKGYGIVSTRSNANNNGECSAYLKERFSNNIDPKNFHIVIVPFSRCLYENDIFNLGHKKVRNTFFLKEGNYNEAITELDQLIANISNVLIPRYITWPINTNKQFWFSIEDSYLLNSLLVKG